MLRPQVIALASLTVLLTWTGVQATSITQQPAAPEPEKQTASRSYGDALRRASVIAAETGDLMALIAKCEPNRAGAQEKSAEAARYIFRRLGSAAPVLENQMMARSAILPSVDCAEVNVTEHWEENASFIVETALRQFSAGTDIAVVEK